MAGPSPSSRPSPFPLRPMNAPPTRRPPRPPRPLDPNRDSNALRASVLDAAIAIGFGSSRTVENWMFNDSVREEDEDEDVAPSPALTYADTATSEESSPSAFPDSPPSNPYRSSPAAFASSPAFDFPYRPGPSPAAQTRILPPPAPKHNKLRKPRRTDGHDSDGGYLSDAAPKPKSSKKPSAPAESDYESDRGYLSDFTKRRNTKTKRKPGALPIDGGQANDSDGGYLSESSKKKRSFFRLKSKSSKSSGLNASSSAPPPPVPPMPAPPTPTPMPLPIADRFVRSPVPGSVSSFDERSRSATPLAAAAAAPRSFESLDDPAYAPEPAGSEDDEAAYDGYELSQTSAEDPAAFSLPSSARRGVRFTPSTRFSHSTAASDDAPPPASPSHPRLSPPLAISAPMRLGALSPLRNPSSLAPLIARPAPSPVPSDYSIVSSSDYIVSSPLPRPLRIGITTADRPPSPLPSPSRARFEYVPPPTPPPTGPLPSLPDQPTIEAPTPVSPGASPYPFAARQAAPPVSFMNRTGASSPLPGGAGAGGSRGPSPGPSLFAQPIPTILRGRESPFPAKPVLPQEDSQLLVRHASLVPKRRGAGPVAITVEDERGRLLPMPTPSSNRGGGRTPSSSPSARELISETDDARTTYAPRDPGRAPVLVVHAHARDGSAAEDIRSDVAQFFFPADTSAPSSPFLSPRNAHARDSDAGLLSVPTDAVARDSLYSALALSLAPSTPSSSSSEADDRSIYPESDARTVRSTGVDSYYFGEGGARGSVWSRASFLDDEKSGSVRERFVQRVDAMMREQASEGETWAIPPVPPLPSAVRRAPMPF
ncbi:hypothetical protein OF83DRAFT_1087159 [Amylostereum chailletii]|nr:hypothetical protein OF83DRAFT_1087159 [Amylostereum chailletii]